MRRIASVSGLDSGIGNESRLISDGNVIDALSSANGVILDDVPRGISGLLFDSLVADRRIDVRTDFVAVATSGRAVGDGSSKAIDGDAVD